MHWSLKLRSCTAAQRGSLLRSPSSIFKFRSRYVPKLADRHPPSRAHGFYFRKTTPSRRAALIYNSHREPATPDLTWGPIGFLRLLGITQWISEKDTSGNLEARRFKRIFGKSTTRGDEEVEQRQQQQKNMSTSPIVKKPVPNSGLVLRTDNVSLRGAYDRRGSDGVSISPVSPVSPASREPSSPVHRPESFASIRSSIVSGATNSPVHRRPSTASVGSIVSSVMSDTKSSSGPNAKEKGKGKEKLPSVFHLLPREIIQQ